MGRHELASRRHTSWVLLAALAAPAAMLLSAAADVRSSADTEAQPVASAPVCCLEVVALPAAIAAPPADGLSRVNSLSGQLVPASRLRVVPFEVWRALPAGDAPESGLQVRTILTARSISAVFPEISNIGGVRPDALRWHPDGLALDVMIPDPGSDAGIALGNQIVAYVLKHSERFGVRDVIWRGAYYTPGNSPTYGAGHFDHVHITTTGGGYPNGTEIYVG